MVASDRTVVSIVVSEARSGSPPYCTENIVTTTAVGQAAQITIEPVSAASAPISFISRRITTGVAMSLKKQVIQTFAFENASFKGALASWQPIMIMETGTVAPAAVENTSVRTAGSFRCRRQIISAATLANSGTGRENPNLPSP